MPLFALLVITFFYRPKSHMLSNENTPGYEGFYFRQQQKVVAWHKASLGELDPDFAWRQEDIARAHEIGRREDGTAELAVVGLIPGCDFGIMVKPVASDGQANMPYQEPLGLEAALAEFDPHDTSYQLNPATIREVVDRMHNQAEDRFRPH